jgi:hypothetical protein
LNKHSVIILLQTAIIVALLVMIWRPAGHGAASSPDNNPGGLSDAGYKRLEQRIENLEINLEQEVLNRQQLEQKLALETQTQHIQAQVIEPDEHSRSADLEVTGRDSQNIEEAQSIQQNLISQGLPPDTVNRIQNFVDNRRLQRLQLRDQAIREGWQNSDKFIEKMNQLSDSGAALKQEFGDKVYDQYLYAAGRPNRVVVREVINGSVAEAAGIAPGDIILSYANQPIYSMSDLRQATTEGIAGESVLLEYQRDKQPYSTTVARGPLGISMDFTRLQP